MISGSPLFLFWSRAIPERHCLCELIFTRDSVFGKDQFPNCMISVNESFDVGPVWFIVFDDWFLAVIGRLLLAERETNDDSKWTNGCSLATTTTRLLIIGVNSGSSCILPLFLYCIYTLHMLRIRRHRLQCRYIKGICVH